MESSKSRPSTSDPSSVIPTLTTTFTTLDRDLELIEAVKKHEIIYDPRYTRPKDPRTKDLTWNIIGAEISATPYDCRNRWRALRDRFVREKKSLLLGQKEGTATGRRLKEWRLLEPMSFLWKFIMHRSRRSGVPGENAWPATMTDDQLVKLEATEGSHPDMLEDDEEEDEGFEWIVEPETKRARQESLSPADLPVVSSASNLAMPAQSEVQELPQHEDYGAPTGDDEDSLFCKSVAHTLRRLAPRRKALAKLRMLQALYDAEFGSESGPDVEVRLKNQTMS